MAQARAELKDKLKDDPSFRSELRGRIKNALGLRLPPAQAVNYNFDSYMLQDIEVGACCACCCWWWWD